MPGKSYWPLSFLITNTVLLSYRPFKYIFVVIIIILCDCLLCAVFVAVAVVFVDCHPPTKLLQLFYNIARLALIDLPKEHFIIMIYLGPLNDKEMLRILL